MKVLDLMVDFIKMSKVWSLCMESRAHKVIISLAIRHIGYQTSPGHSYVPKRRKRQ